MDVNDDWTPNCILGHRRSLNNPACLCVYGDYLEKALPEEFACIHGLPIWIARTTVDGGDALRMGNKNADKQTQRMCLITGGNKCVVHQYSHRGLIGALGKPINDEPPHIDLDRLFLSVSVTDATGEQLVRKERLSCRRPGIAS